ncbi:MAG: hypothetical protein H7X89_00810 [Rhizobiales bacterium]|nr:hypothetical protein [Hyphomicrobiales bacterium]
MTPNTTVATNGQTPATDRSKPRRSRKPAKRKSAPASRRAAKRPSGRGSAAGSYSDTASRLMSQGKQALGTAYGWASDNAGRAGRAIPRAARYVPDQRTIQNLIEERPLVLGAIGLGLGAIIGMMLPSRLMGGSAPARRRRSSRKS